MRTTLTIDSDVLAAFKHEAARTHRTLSGLIEDALREHLARLRDSDATKPLDFPIVGGEGFVTDADLSTTARLLDYADALDASGKDPADAQPHERSAGDAA